jgi:cytochrome d ubiquinol oxidase subunit II
MTLADVWFVLIAVLWMMFFVLEGFDYGVGMNLPVVSRSDTERRVVVNTIGPVWDGNEVWLLVAGAAIFAAFPEWYAALFSALYIPLTVLVIALVLRGVAFEYRGKRDDSAWRARWDVAIVIGSTLPPLLLGVAFANIVRGLPIDADHQYTGTVLTGLNPYGLLGGVTVLAVCFFLGAVYLALKTGGEVRERARGSARIGGAVAAVLAVAFLLWTQWEHGDVASAVLIVLGALALLGSLWFVQQGRDGVAFSAAAAAMALTVVALFVVVYPTVLPSTLDPAFDLTVENASSTDYTLTIMTWVAVPMTPLVLLYQGWSYWVFRRRLTVERIPPAVYAGHPDAPRE